MDSRVERGCPNPLSQMIPPLKIPSLPHTLLVTSSLGCGPSLRVIKEIFFASCCLARNTGTPLGPTLGCTGGCRKNWGSKTDLCTGPGGSLHGGRGGAKQIIFRSFWDLCTGGGDPCTGGFGSLHGGFWIPARGRFGSLHGSVLDPCTGAFWILARGFLRCKGSILDPV